MYSKLIWDCSFLWSFCNRGSLWSEVPLYTRVVCMVYSIIILKAGLMGCQGGQSKGVGVARRGLCPLPQRKLKQNSASMFSILLSQQFKI